MLVSKIKKLLGIKCCAYRCNSPPNKKYGGMCSKHYQRKVKENDPVLYRYQNFKGNAKRRKKEFTITLDEFRNFCQETGYIIDKGKCGRNATIDRIDNRYGYHIWNIQLLTAKQNTRKYYDVDIYLEELPF